MAERLRQEPVWRQRYFSFAEPLANPEVLDGRLRLFEYMAEQGIPTNRGEMETTLFALYNSGRKDAIANIVRTQLPVERRAQLIYDPEFEQLLEVPRELLWATSPRRRPSYLLPPESLCHR